MEYHIGKIEEVKKLIRNAFYVWKCLAFMRVAGVAISVFVKIDVEKGDADLLIFFVELSRLR